MPELKRILHVEDDPSIQAVAQVALEIVGGFELLSCASGQEALDKVQAFAPDFILLDVMMPGMDGPQTLENMQGLVDLARVPVVFMTAKVQASEVAQYRARGAFDVIVKPFDPMQLASQIRWIWKQFHE